MCNLHSAAPRDSRFISDFGNTPSQRNESVRQGLFSVRGTRVGLLPGVAPPSGPSGNPTCPGTPPLDSALDAFAPCAHPFPHNPALISQFRFGSTSAQLATLHPRLHPSTPTYACLHVRHGEKDVARVQRSAVCMNADVRGTPV